MLTNTVRLSIDCCSPTLSDCATAESSFIVHPSCGKTAGEGIPTLTRLGFTCYLSRDLTDAQSHYDPLTFSSSAGWISPDWGTKNVTAAIERSGIALTFEAGALAATTGVSR